MAKKNKFHKKNNLVLMSSSSGREKQVARLADRVMGHTWAEYHSVRALYKFIIIMTRR